MVRSENTRIQEGTFVGDVYVEAPGFHLVGATVDGDIYFETGARAYSDYLPDAFQAPRPESLIISTVSAAPTGLPDTLRALGACLTNVQGAKELPQKSITMISMWPPASSRPRCHRASSSRASSNA